LRAFNDCGEGVLFSRSGICGGGGLRAGVAELERGGRFR